MLRIASDIILLYHVLLLQLWDRKELRIEYTTCCPSFAVFMDVVPVAGQWHGEPSIHALQGNGLGEPSIHTFQGHGHGEPSIQALQGHGHGEPSIHALQGHGHGEPSIHTLQGPG